MAGPTGLSSSDVLRDLFTMPSRQWNEFQSMHWCLSLWDKLRDEHFRDVVLTYAAYAAIPLIAAEVAPWLMLPLALTGVGERIAGLAVLGAAAGIAGAGTAWLNVENGEKWYQGLGLQLVATVGELWARAGGGAESVGAGRTNERVYFRGTSVGYPGGRALQRIGVTPTTTDPVVATLFATHAEQYGEGTVLMATAGDLSGVEMLEGSWLREIEAEVGFSMKPAEFAQAASMRVSSSQARRVLGLMGVDMPSIIGTKQELDLALATTPRLDSLGVQTFVSMVRRILEDR